MARRLATTHSRAAVLAADEVRLPEPEKKTGGELEVEGGVGTRPVVVAGTG